MDEGAPDVTGDLKALPGAQAVEAYSTPDGRAYRVQGAEGADLRPAIYELARQDNWPLRELRRDIRTLETVFNELASAANDDLNASKGGDEA
ncbi:MAG: hypothetical protein ISS50_03855 [Anaerolineae bacterium]|nr:hypothetical protein [Anaerolineae bacterium]